MRGRLRPRHSPRSSSSSAKQHVPLEPVPSGAFNHNPSALVHPRRSFAQVLDAAGVATPVQFDRDLGVQTADAYHPCLYIEGKRCILNEPLCHASFCLTTTARHNWRKTDGTNVAFMTLSTQPSKDPRGRRQW